VDYPQLSRDILPLVGGTANISSFTNCMTRLRLEVIDPESVDLDALKALDGVIGVVSGDQLQVVVGPGHAQRLRDAFAVESGMSGSAPLDDDEAPLSAADDLRQLQTKNNQKVKSRQKTGVHSLFRHIGNIFIPIIPGFIACGLIVAIANVWKIIDPGVAQNPWFLAFAALGSIVVGSLNLLVGYNTAKEFGGTPVLGLIAGGISYMPALAGIAATTAADGTAN